MTKVMDDALRQRLEEGVEALRSERPTTAEERDKALAALMELQLKKQQQNEIGFWKFRASGPVTWLIVIAFAFIVLVIAPYLGGWIHEWRSMKAAVARMQAVEAQAAPAERESP